MTEMLLLRSRGMRLTSLHQQKGIMLRQRTGMGRRVAQRVAYRRQWLRPECLLTLQPCRR